MHLGLEFLELLDDRTARIEQEDLVGKGDAVDAIATKNHEVLTRQQVARAGADRGADPSPVRLQEPSELPKEDLQLCAKVDGANCADRIEASGGGDQLHGEGDRLLAT